MSAVLQWVEYFHSPDRSSRQLFNVLSLSLAGTPLETKVGIYGGGVVGGGKGRLAVLVLTWKEDSSAWSQGGERGGGERGWGVGEGFLSRAP